MHLHEPSRRLGRSLEWDRKPAVAPRLDFPSQAAQAGFTGSVVGTVIDATHAAIPEADVIVTNVGTNQSVAVRTDRSGTYFVPNLQPGTYSLDISATGFKRMVRSGITLQIDQRARVIEDPAEAPPKVVEFLAAAKVI